MADNLKLTQLAMATNLNTNDLLYLVNSGSSKSVRLGDISVDNRLTILSGSGGSAINVNLVPNWLSTNGGWVAIDVGTDQCEIRRVDSGSIIGNVISVSTLNYAHSAWSESRN